MKKNTLIHTTFTLMMLAFLIAIAKPASAQFIAFEIDPNGCAAFGGFFQSGHPVIVTNTGNGTVKATCTGAAVIPCSFHQQNYDAVYDCIVTDNNGDVYVTSNSLFVGSNPGPLVDEGDPNDPEDDACVGHAMIQCHATIDDQVN